MKTDEVERFGAALIDMLTTLSHGKANPDSRQISQWFRLLEPYPLPAVLAGMTAHMRAPDTGRTLPIPADIIKQINATVANDGRPGADEAWAIAAQSADEGATVVWTEEIAEAWGAARSVMALGDEVGARVAFRDVYNRIVHDARCARRPLVWQAALGTDRTRQASALRIAVDMGRIKPTELAEVEALPAPRGALQLAAPVDADGKPSKKGIEALRAVRAALAARSGEYRPSTDAIAKQATVGRRAEVQRQTTAYLDQRAGAAG